MTPLPIEPELADVLRRAKLQLANWGLLTSNGPPREFKSIPVDTLITRDDAAGRNLAEAISECLSLNEHSFALSHHKRLVTITLIHALDEIDRLRGESEIAAKQFVDSRAREGYLEKLLRSVGEGIATARRWRSENDPQCAGTMISHYQGEYLERAELLHWFDRILAGLG